MTPKDETRPCPWCDAPMRRVVKHRPVRDDAIGVPDTADALYYVDVWSCPNGHVLKEGDDSPS